MSTRVEPKLESHMNSLSHQLIFRIKLLNALKFFLHIAQRADNSGSAVFWALSLVGSKEAARVQDVARKISEIQEGETSRNSFDFLLINQYIGP